MIKIENVVLPIEDQWNSIIMGARNPLNSWSRSDSGTCMGTLPCHSCEKNRTTECNVTVKHGDFIVGPKDKDLMKRLRNAGTDHRISGYHRSVILVEGIRYVQGRNRRQLVQHHAYDSQEGV